MELKDKKTSQGTMDLKWTKNGQSPYGLMRVLNHVSDSALDMALMLMTWDDHGEGHVEDVFFRLTGQCQGSEWAYMPPCSFGRKVFLRCAELSPCPTCGTRGAKFIEGTVRQDAAGASVMVDGSCGAVWEFAASSSYAWRLGASLKASGSHNSHEAKSCAPAFDDFVYFIEAVGLQRIKIGYSKDPDARLKSLQTGSPVPLVEIGRIPGDQQSETDLHQQFDHLRLDGEWFHAAKQLRDHIRGLK